MISSFQPLPQRQCSLCSGAGKLFCANDSKYQYCHSCLLDMRTALWELAPESSDYNPLFAMLALGTGNAKVTNWTVGWKDGKRADREIPPEYQFWVETRHGGHSYQLLKLPKTGIFSYESIIKAVDSK